MSTHKDILSPRLRLALRAVSNNRDEFEQAYRTMTAPELRELYDLEPNDVRALREHWGIGLKSPKRSAAERVKQPQLAAVPQIDVDALAERGALKVWELLVAASRGEATGELARGVTEGRGDRRAGAWRDRGARGERVKLRLVTVEEVQRAELVAEVEESLDDEERLELKLDALLEAVPGAAERYEESLLRVAELRDKEAAPN